MSSCQLSHESVAETLTHTQTNKITPNRYILIQNKFLNLPSLIYIRIKTILDLEYPPQGYLEVGGGGGGEGVGISVVLSSKTRKNVVRGERRTGFTSPENQSPVGLGDSNNFAPPIRPSFVVF